MVKIRNVGTNHGDCFFIEVESGINKSIIMVDGRKGDQKSFNEIKEVILEYESINYLIVTHIDNDHINGILKIYNLSKTDPVRQAFLNTIILYNYVTKPVISYSQAQEFEKLIQDNVVVSTVNKYYYQYYSPCLKILSATQRKDMDPREQEDFENYAVLTLLNPHKEGVEQVCKDYIKHPKESTADLVNRNSIVFMLEYGKHIALFTGDCYMQNIVDEIEQLKNMKEAGNYRKIDMIKMPHHGSKENNEGLAEFARNHGTREFIVTSKEKWEKDLPSKKILMELDDIADGINQIVLHTHTDLSDLGELKHIAIDKNDIIEWRDEK